MLPHNSLRLPWKKSREVNTQRPLLWEGAYFRFSVHCCHLYPTNYPTGCFWGKWNILFHTWKRRIYIFLVGKKDWRGILGISAFQWISLLCCLVWTLFVSVKQAELLFHAGKAQDNVPREHQGQSFSHLTRHLPQRNLWYNPKDMLFISGNFWRWGRDSISTDVVHKWFKILTGTQHTY